ncbi:response regulator transcription factor [Sphingomonas sp. BN140010]|uniref:Response regulator transcription factor n=1 Tax=Sphingomonas arvum TaxID=2992113 RepID=A0ABT3JD47_9SPHN|nr:response regulator transcription factor [Sphingomonas sp. BN140010]MCW3796993.1 response regulator transcription factor [Sphingomonas sp. BN140010]
MSARRSVAIVAEEQGFFNAGLAAMLQNEIGFSKVLRTSNYKGLMALLADNLKVDLLVIDFELPGASGLTTLQELHEAQPGMRIAVLCEQMNSRDGLAILAAGAHGVIPKQITSCAELQQALRTVDQSSIFIPASLIEPAKWNQPEDDFNPEAFAGLTSRQQQVISLLYEGHPNKVIARELGISPSTVKVHVHAAFRALGVHSRLAAMAALRASARAVTEA